jgi:hypothetical protein
METLISGPLISPRNFYETLKIVEGMRFPGKLCTSPKLLPHKLRGPARHFIQETLLVNRSNEKMPRLPGND